MSKDFAGRIMVITGGGRGMGRGIAEVFAAAGARVMLGARTMSYAEEAQTQMRAKGWDVAICEADVARHEDCTRLIEETVRHFGGVDIVIHCAADIAHGGLGAVTDDRLEAGIASTVKAAWWLLDAARPHLAKSAGGGRFIAIGSVNGTVTVVPNMTAYGIAKGALNAFIRGAAVDVVKENITVNAILPGLVESVRSLAMLGEDGLKAYGATVPVGRGGTSDDIAHGCMFLASTKASYITGQSIVMDGGSSLAPSSRGGSDILQGRLRDVPGH
jgi:3-oxoacyl-[acyl-carrier protein] reductase